MGERKEYAVTNIAKFVGACVVLANHSFASDAYGLYWLSGLTKSVVQMYFVFSGFFFLESEAHKKKEKQKKWMKHLLCLTLLWSLVYFVTDIAYVDRSAEYWFLDYMVAEVNDLCSLCFGSLWYVQNLIVVVAVLVVLQKYSFSERELLLYSIAMVFLEGKLLRALAAVAYGMYLAQIKQSNDVKRKVCLERFQRMGCSAAILMIIVYEMAEFGAQGVWLRYAFNLTWNVTGLWIATSVLLLDWKLCDTGKPILSTYYLRKLSTVIYFVHLIIVPLSYGFIQRYLPTVAALGGRSIIWSGMVALLTFAASLFVGIGVLWLSEKKGFYWLKYIC